MKQSKLESHLESTANIASGFVLSLLVWTFVVGPLVMAGIFHPNSMRDAFYITAIFTVTSYIRSYVWRRFFNAGIHKQIHKFIKFVKAPELVNDSSIYKLEDAAKVLVDAPMNAPFKKDDFVWIHAIDDNGLLHVHRSGRSSEIYQIAPKYLNPWRRKVHTSKSGAVAYQDHPYKNAFIEGAK